MQSFLVGLHTDQPYQQLITDMSSGVNPADYASTAHERVSSGDKRVDSDDNASKINDGVGSYTESIIGVGLGVEPDSIMSGPGAVGSDFKSEKASGTEAIQVCLTLYAFYCVAIHYIPLLPHVHL